MQKSLFFLVLLPGILLGIENQENTPLPLGNFSVPVASQLAPLVSFGQLLIGKKALLPQFSGIYTQGHHSYADVVSPNIIYGLRDDLSIFFSVPITPKSRLGSSHSSGIKDILLQLEYGFYNKTRSDYFLQATVVGNVQFPSGSGSKIPPTGNGAFSYFLGATYAYLSSNWYAFVSPGVNLTTSRHHTKFGNSYLYQWGFARYIKQLSPKGWVFDLMIEFDGTYSCKNEIRGVTDPNSGGNVLLLTPSIWMSSKRLILQGGVGFPIIQSLNGHQSRIEYAIDYNLGLAFQF